MASIWSTLVSLLGKLPLFSVAYLLAIVGIVVILKIKRKLKERRMKDPSFAKSSTRSEAKLNQLPKEILETIFLFLDARGISTASTISRYWNHVISNRNIKQQIFSDTLASIKTTKHTLEHIIGGQVDNGWLIDSQFPASYPEQSLIHDYERWKIFEFTRAANIYQWHNFFAEDPTLAIRLRGKYCWQNDKYWYFELGPNSLQSRFQVAKDPARTENWPYYPCKGIIEDGSEYDLIVNLSCILNFPHAPVKRIHQIRPLSHSSKPYYNRLPSTCKLVFSLGLMMVAMLILDCVRWFCVYIATNYKMSLEPNSVYCTRDSSILWLRTLGCAGLVVLHSPATIAKFFPREEQRRRLLKTGAWVLGNFIVFNLVLLYFETLGWWFEKSVMMLVPHELAQLHNFISDIRHVKNTRRFGNLVLVTFAAPCALILLSTAVFQRNDFSLQAYLVHVVLSLVTFGYFRLVYVNTFRFLNPNAFSSSRSFQKWIHWSLPVKWWFFIILVVIPMFTLVCSCLHLFLWG